MKHQDLSNSDLCRVYKTFFKVPLNALNKQAKTTYSNIEHSLLVSHRLLLWQQCSNSGHKWYCSTTNEA